ncbi:hypothetical protein KQH27_00845 [bacterium]|nr:hypothetical protein [bacterium]
MRMSNDQIMKELRNIKAVLTFSNSNIIENKLKSIIKTKPRKLIWIHRNENTTQTELAEIAGISQPSVSEFVKIANKARIIDITKKGQPYRVLDYIPPDWLELLEDKNQSVEKEKEEEKTLDEYR